MLFFYFFLFLDKVKIGGSESIQLSRADFNFTKATTKAQRNMLLLTTTPSLQSKVSYIFCEKPIHLTAIYATCLAMVLRHLRNKLLGWSYTVQDSCNCNSHRMRRGLAKIKVLITRLMSTNRYEASCMNLCEGSYTEQCSKKLLPQLL